VCVCFLRVRVTTYIYIIMQRLVSSFRSLTSRASYRLSSSHVKQVGSKITQSLHCRIPLSSSGTTTASTASANTVSLPCVSSLWTGFNKRTMSSWSQNLNRHMINTSSLTSRLSKLHTSTTIGVTSQSSARAVLTRLGGVAAFQHCFPRSMYQQKSVVPSHSGSSRAYAYNHSHAKAREIAAATRRQVEVREVYRLESRFVRYYRMGAYTAALFLLLWALIFGIMLYREPTRVVEFSLLTGITLSYFAGAMYVVSRLCNRTAARMSFAGHRKLLVHFIGFPRTKQRTFDIDRMLPVFAHTGRDGRPSLHSIEVVKQGGKGTDSILVWLNHNELRLNERQQALFDHLLNEVNPDSSPRDFWT
jgi:hypothetical protein